MTLTSVYILEKERVHEAYRVSFVLSRELGGLSAARESESDTNANEDEDAAAMPPPPSPQKEVSPIFGL